MIGQVVGHYRILEKIGAGGMGEVYRAHDERLGRDVALKLVRASSSSNPDHLRRFEQEARAAAALNHPGIVAIYDVGSDRGIPYIVSELLEGMTLRTALARGPIPFKQAAEYALQIVRGLAAAHEHRIVHRDLKPENLFVTRDGRIKILDFGVAKLQSPESNEPVENLPTITKTGTVVGTVAYMSPEQLRGKAVDHRSDIFALGAILYEMLTGTRAFRGETEVDTMTAVLREEPSETRLEEASIPTAFRSVVHHCLEKEPEDRFQSARDLGFALETLSGTSPTKAVAFKPMGAALKAVPWAVACALAASLFVLWIKSRGWSQNPPEYKRVTFENGTVYAARFAPDGQSILYSAAWNGKPLQLFSTVGNSLLAQPLTFTDANLLGVSRSNELAILQGGTHRSLLEIENGVLASAPMAGGSPRPILADVRAADWDPKGEIAVVRVVDGHGQIEYPIGHILYRSPAWISYIRFSPDGNNIAFMDHPSMWDDRGTVALTDLAGHMKVLTREWECEDGLAWRPDGKEIWFTASPRGRNRDLFAVTLSGKIRRLLNLPSALTIHDISSDGRTLISTTTERLAMAATVGKDHHEQDVSWHDWNVAKDLSADGQSVLFEDSSEASGAQYSVAIRRLDGTAPIRLGPGSAGGLSLDGKWAISILTESPQHVQLLPIGPGQPQDVALHGLSVQNGTARFLPDGNHISLNANEPGHAVRCYIVGLHDQSPRPVTPEGVSCMEVSPNGRWVLPSGGASGLVLYSTEEGESPRKLTGMDPQFVPVRWSKDSAALYGYVSGEIPAKVYKFDIASGKKTLLRELLTEDTTGVVSLSPVVVDRDGSRFAYSYSQVLSTLYVVSGLQ